MPDASRTFSPRVGGSILAIIALEAEPRFGSIVGDQMCVDPLRPGTMSCEAIAYARVEEAGRNF